ncbi:MAG: mechanosensitive ion channel [Bacteroidaceae bacterium]|nr:mechanosensitive ion channel [Bacteroidaceae bacterium]
MILTVEIGTQLNEIVSKLIASGIDLGERILGALVIFIVGKFLVNWANRLLAKILAKRKVEVGVQTFLKSMANILLMIMLGLAVIGRLGIELTGFAALLASAGVAVGMALSGNLQNFAGGIIILIFRPYKVGDYIEANTGASGTVQEIQIFHTVLVTPDNKVVYAPNGAMSNAVVTNYSHKEVRRVDFNFGVEYGTDFEHVQAILKKLIGADKRILTTPEPFIELGQLADSSVNITVRVWVNASDYWGVYFDMNKAVYTTFNNEGIEFPFPQLTVHQA